MTYRTLVVALLLSSLSALVCAEEELRQSFRSCGIITSERLTALQFQQQGLSLEQLKVILPVNSPKAFDRIGQVYELVDKKGPVATYQILNLFYQECAQQVYERHGKPPVTHPEYGFYLCSGENALRAKILVAQAQGIALAQARQLIPSARHELADELFALVDKAGTAAAYDESARRLKSCLNENLNVSGP